MPWLMNPTSLCSTVMQPSASCLEIARQGCACPWRGNCSTNLSKWTVLLQGTAAHLQALSSALTGAPVSLTIYDAPNSALQSICTTVHSCLNKMTARWSFPFMKNMEMSDKDKRLCTGQSTVDILTWCLSCWWRRHLLKFHISQKQKCREGAHGNVTIQRYWSSMWQSFGQC